jgi:hypothetical protein
VQTALSSGLSPTGVIGIRFALTPGKGRTAVPARSVLVGATIAVAIVTATLTFNSGLHTLVSRPALYGWNWNYALSSENDVPPQALVALNRDHDVSAWSGYHPLSVQIDGQSVPVLLGANHAAVAPPILSGHVVDANNQIVLGAITLSLLHKHVGDTVVFSFGSPATAPLYLPPARLVIVGTATVPAIGGSGNYAEHPSMGTGAVVSETVSPAIRGAAQQSDSNLNGPGMVFVRLHSNVGSAVGMRDMKRIAQLAGKVFATDPNTAGDNVQVLSVQHPAEIVNYNSTRATPVVLAAGLALGATAALALTLIASVRRRRRSRPVEDPRIHYTAAGRHDRLAGLSHRRDRRNCRSAYRHCCRTATMDRLCSQYQCRAPTHSTHVTSAGYCGRIDTGKSRSGDSRTYCRSDTRRFSASNRVALNRNPGRKSAGWQ